MMPSDLKKVFAWRRKSAPHLFMAPFISPSHVFAVYPVTASSGVKWNYIVCAQCPKVNMYCDIFPLWLCRAALLFSHLHNLKRWESWQHCLLLSAFIEPIHRRVSIMFSDPMHKCLSHHIFSTECNRFCFRLSGRESLTVFSQSFHFLETSRGHFLSYCCRMYRYVPL